MLDLLSCHVLLYIYYMITKLVMANFYEKYVHTYTCTNTLTGLSVAP